MSSPNLPPLLADTHYRVVEFQTFEYGHRSLRRAATGEDTSILHLHLKNRTTLDLPVSDEAMIGLMMSLMEMYPRKAIDRLKQRWPKEFAPKGS